MTFLAILSALFFVSLPLCLFPNDARSFIRSLVRASAVGEFFCRRVMDANHNFFEKFASKYGELHQNKIMDESYDMPENFDLDTEDESKVLKEQLAIEHEKVSKWIHAIDKLQTSQYLESKHYFASDLEKVFGVQYWTSNRVNFEVQKYFQNYTLDWSHSGATVEETQSALDICGNFLEIKDRHQLEKQYYMRFAVDDEFGVFAASNLTAGTVLDECIGMICLSSYQSSTVAFQDVLFWPYPYASLETKEKFILDSQNFGNAMRFVRKSLVGVNLRNVFVPYQYFFYHLYLAI